MIISRYTNYIKLLFIVRYFNSPRFSDVSNLKENPMKFVLFEDEKINNLAPAIYFRPAWEIRSGAKSLEQKIKHYLSENLAYVAREYIENNPLNKNLLLRNMPADEEVTLVNGRLVIKPADVEKIKSLKVGQCLRLRDNVIAFRTTVDKAIGQTDAGLVQSENVFNEFENIAHNANIINYVWDAIYYNKQELVDDFHAFNPNPTIKGTLHDGVYFVNKEQIMVEEGVEIRPNVVLDASYGPIWIDKDVRIMPGSTIEGPVYIGKNSEVINCANIQQHTSIGKFSKVGGEINNSIMHNFANKRHDGCTLEYSYLGSWVNIGAGTICSDLKNTYGNIKVQMLTGEKVDTKKMFLGMIAGDHTKIAVNSTFYSGTIIGANCNIFGDGVHNNIFQSFSWGADKSEVFDLEKAIEVAERVMARRDIEFTEEIKQTFLGAYNYSEMIEKD